MNRIDELFRKKSGGILSVYLTAGYPELDDTTTVIAELASSGVDLIEVGMPFSDPLADGPLLQECNQQALDKGMSLEVLFRQLSDIRQSVSIPLILMGYLNPVLNFGFEAFCSRAAAIGIDGLILPDLPLDEYEQSYQEICEKHGLHMIFLITPQSSEERIHRIAELSKGFIYMVSAAATTGARQGFQPEQISYFKRISAMNLSIPALIGFGISTAETFKEACEYARGAIIGSAFMKSLSGEGTIPDKVQSFVEGLEPLKGSKL
jgi:tryptophan synthase alpha chain